ncbi:glycosyltransferase family protein [Teichococcus rhizosphaerae]|uniref:hypothetical protein n=1 Tax=Teichococcus rhizosphaerae TaxID=1335062 RepID=UPI0011452F48|nr:hypothetical protein [Pseudoroseomonas rhizosphaerae]
MSGLSKIMPVVVMGFNRPQYLKRVLESIRLQNGGEWKSREIHFFQDGGVNFISNERYADDDVLNQSVDVFRSIFPEGHVHRSDKNIGVALNFERAERYIFLERTFSRALFCEDDMTLGPNYLLTIEKLLDFAESPAAEGLVGYVAAYGNHRANLEQQEKHCQEIIKMEHAWGYGVNREHWLKVREVIDPYIQIVSGCDYRKRPKARIGGVHKKLGLATRSLSQDAMKMLATSSLGRTRVMPFICQATYIGEEGLNFNPDIFSQKGYGREELFPGPIPEFLWPTAEVLRGMITKEQSVFIEHCKQAYGERDMPIPPEGKFRALEHLNLTDRGSANSVSI